MNYLAPAPRRGSRLRATGRGLAYLLTALAAAAAALPALPVLLLPGPGRAWASWHRRRAERLLHVRPGAGGSGPGWWRRLGWLGAGTSGGLAAGALAVLCAGNAVATAVTVPLWWALPPRHPGGRLRARSPAHRLGQRADARSRPGPAPRRPDAQAARP
ncbi:hypothetical protein ACFV6F_08225 [Kitasatospora phosalacinea]|uniref:hypothetical protein n=1 Tax=Kitasatospora phosalacinea TaxID=2065 RepID=UPI003659E73B